MVSDKTNCKLSPDIPPSILVGGGLSGRGVAQGPEKREILPQIWRFCSELETSRKGQGNMK